MVVLFFIIIGVLPGFCVYADKGVWLETFLKLIQDNLEMTNSHVLGVFYEKTYFNNIIIQSSSNYLY